MEEVSNTWVTSFNEGVSREKLWKLYREI